MLGALALVAAPGAADQKALDALVQAERSFSATSVEKGMRDAFLAFLADDGILFRPLPVNGKKVWEPRPPYSATLIWEPSFAEVSAAGDLGYTTGPWEFRPPADKPDQPIAHGHFISVWRKKAGGEWRVLVDIGVSHDKPERGVGSGDFTAGPDHGAASAATPKKIERARAELLEAERACSRKTQVHGADAAFTACASADVRTYVEGALPRLGLAAAQDTSAQQRGSTRWLPVQGGVANSWTDPCRVDPASRFGRRARLQRLRARLAQGSEWEMEDRAGGG